MTDAECDTIIAAHWPRTKPTDTLRHMLRDAEKIGRRAGLQAAHKACNAVWMNFPSLRHGTIKCSAAIVELIEEVR